MASTQASSFKKWTDENGRVSYGDTPPRSVNTETIKTNKRPSNLGKPLPRLSTKPDEPAPTEDTASPSSPKALDPEQAKVACEVAKKHLIVLENNDDVRLRSADGSSRYMTPDEIQQRLDINYDNIKKHCK